MLPLLSKVQAIVLQGAIALKFQTILLPVLGAPYCLAVSGTVNKELDSPFDMNLDVREQPN